MHYSYDLLSRVVPFWGAPAGRHVDGQQNLPDDMEARVEGPLLPEPADECPGSLWLCRLQLGELVLVGGKQKERWESVGRVGVLFSGAFTERLSNTSALLYPEGGFLLCKYW